MINIGLFSNVSFENRLTFLRFDSNSHYDDVFRSRLLANGRYLLDLWRAGGNSQTSQPAAEFGTQKEPTFENFCLLTMLLEQHT